MTDRELLELAAKASGIRLHVWGTPGSENFADLDAKPYGALWNPLTDDGDALRLAVKLDLLNHPRFLHERDVLMFTQSMGKLEATRRAIVRAAAEIGKAMQQELGRTP